MPKKLKDFRIIDGFKQLANLKGILITDRDGVLIYKNSDIHFDYQEFAAMCASVLESAVGLGKTIGNRDLVKIITELEGKTNNSEKQTLLTINGKGNTFLTLIIDDESKIEGILENFNEKVHEIIDSF